jgi:hypothetical protein
LILLVRPDLDQSDLCLHGNSTIVKVWDGGMSVEDFIFDPYSAG